LRNCRYVILDGSGATGVTYGFQATGIIVGVTKQVLISNRSRHIEVNNVESANGGGILMRVHTKNDSGYDYEESSPSTPSTFSGAGAYTDEDFYIHDCSWHDGSQEGAYLGNNSAARDNDPDMTQMRVQDCVADSCDLELYDMKTMTEGQITDCVGTNAALDDVSGSQGGVHLGPGAEVVVTGHADTGSTGQNYHVNNAWRACEVLSSTGTNAGLDAFRVTENSAQATDAGVMLIDSCTTVNPGQSAVDTDKGRPVSAAASLISNNTFQHAAASACIEQDDEIVPTSNNVCTPV
jgi:hypothetical protein